MPDTALLDRPATSTAGGEDLLHLTCCDDDVALCGEDVSDDEWAEDGPVCVPCETAWALGGPCGVAGCVRGRMGP